MEQENESSAEKIFDTDDYENQQTRFEDCENLHVDPKNIGQYRGWRKKYFIAESAEEKFWRRLQTRAARINK